MIATLRGDLRAAAHAANIGTKPCAVAFEFHLNGRKLAVARMYILENLRRRLEQATGHDKPTPRQARSRLLRRRPRTHLFRDDGLIPNNPRLPLVLYRRAVRLEGAPDPAAMSEEVFQANRWGDSWRNGIYDYVHFHSRTHEVLGIARGRARVRVGGSKGAEIDVTAGDVVILPVGTGHQCLMASGNLLVVGAYPPQGTYDECRGSAEEHARSLDTIPDTPLPETDPVYGQNGPLLRLWQGG